jgi:hypothetical protein
VRFDDTFTLSNLQEAVKLGAVRECPQRTTVFVKTEDCNFYGSAVFSGW